MITLKFWRGVADDRTVIEQIHLPELLAIPPKVVAMGDRQPPPRRQPQRRPDNIPATKVYSPHGVIDGADGAMDEEIIPHIDLVG